MLNGAHTWLPSHGLSAKRLSGLYTVFELLSVLHMAAAYEYVSAGHKQHAGHKREGRLTHCKGHHSHDHVVSMVR